MPKLLFPVGLLLAAMMVAGCGAAAQSHEATPEPADGDSVVSQARKPPLPTGASNPSGRHRVRLRPR